ncbi:MAG: hypothetical protein FWD19_01140, partial [Defluviitaleaceae bacterium]|nr:hypothetical protein [Defluviitaleaceae bacterium]
MKNPTVFAFANEKILRAAKNLHAPATFFSFDSVEEIPAAKTKIQANEAGLNLTRVNIFVVADENFLPETARAIYKNFAEDFPAVHISLVVLLREKIFDFLFEAHENFLQK